MDRLLFPLAPITRKKFSAEEDQALEALVARDGKNDWHRIALFMPGRDSRQCKERWFHYLSPDVVQSTWTQTEDELLEEKVAQHGRKWKMFETFFPGRVDINIKNRYSVLLRQKNRQMRSPMEVITKSHIRNPQLDQADPPNTSDGLMMWEDGDFDWISFSDQ
jgi:hypothetical protein